VGASQEDGEGQQNIWYLGTPTEGCIGNVRKGAGKRWDSVIE